MEARTIQTLMSINALQALGETNGTSTQNNTMSTFFHEMLMELLENTSTSESISTTALSLLGQTSNYNLSAGIPSMLAPLENNTIGGLNAELLEGNYAGIIEQAAKSYNIPPKLIHSVIRHESNFNNEVVSHAGAQGLMQLMPGTARFLGVQDSFDPVQNIMGGAKYLRQMLDEFGGNYELALAAYNAGPGNVRKYNGIPPFKETEQYVQRVMNSFRV